MGGGDVVCMGEFSTDGEGEKGREGTKERVALFVWAVGGPRKRHWGVGENQGVGPLNPNSSAIEGKESFPKGGEGMPENEKFFMEFCNKCWSKLEWKGRERWGLLYFTIKTAQLSEESRATKKGIRPSGKPRSEI